MMTAVLRRHDNYTPSQYYGRHPDGGGITYMPIAMVHRRLGSTPDVIRVDFVSERAFREGEFTIQAV
jgi:hypothetical protein